MAVEKSIKSVGLKVVSNHGEVEGKTVLTTKTYKDVKKDAVDQAIYSTYEHLTKLQQPAAEECVKITTESLSKTV